MGELVQPIYADNPGSLSATYVLPPGLELKVQSIVARINGAAAAASFLPALSIYTSDDKLMARVRTDTEFAVGDTGVVTWSPFLRRRSTEATVTDISGKIQRTTDQNISHLTVTPIVFDTTLWLAGGVTLNAGSDGLVIPAGAAGRYKINGNLQWEENANGFRAGILTVNDVFQAVEQKPGAAAGAHTENNVSAIVTLAAGDVVKLKGNQGSGVTLKALGTEQGIRLWLALCRLVAT